MNALCISDNWQNLSIYSAVQLADDPDDAGMVFMLMEQKQFFEGKWH